MSHRKWGRKSWVIACVHTGPYGERYWLRTGRPLFSRLQAKKAWKRFEHDPYYRLLLMRPTAAGVAQQKASR